MTKNIPAGVAPGGDDERNTEASDRGVRPLAGLAKRKQNSSTSISRETAAKRSRSHILSEIQYSN